MIDWLKKRLSPVKRDSLRWKELAESIQEFWAQYFDPEYYVLAGLRSIYTADDTNQKRIVVEMGHYFEDGISDENIPVSVSTRKMELHQKETNVPLVRAMARIGFVAEWSPLYAPRGEIYGTAFYTEDELVAAGLDINAELLRLDGSWHIGDSPAVHLASDGVYLTSRAKMVIDLSSGRAPTMIDVARRRITQIKPLHIVFDGFKYKIWLEISAIPTHEMHLAMTKVIDQHYPWCTPKLNGLWKIGTNITIAHRRLNGSWKLNGTADLGAYQISGTVSRKLLQCTITSSMGLAKHIERPDAYFVNRLSESLLKLDGLWHVGMNRVLILSGKRRLKKSIDLPSIPSVGFGSREGWTIQYPVSPRKLGVLPALVSYRRLDGMWQVGEPVRSVSLDGTWKVRSPGIKAESRLKLVKFLGHAGVFGKVGRYTDQVGNGWSRKLDGMWGVGAYCDVDGTWQLDGSKRLGAIRIGRYYRRLDGSWRVGEVTKHLDGSWRIGQPGPVCECEINIRKAA